MTPNVKEIKRVVEFISNHMPQFEMMTYGCKGKHSCGCKGKHSCDTHMCFGGWVLFLNTPVKKRRSLFDEGGYFQVDVRERAANILGLNLEEAHTIFEGTATHYDNTRSQFAELKRVIRRVLLNNYNIKIDFKQKAKSA